MPPDEEPQPPEHQRQAVAGWLARELARIDRVTPPDPGRVTARRLNRAEYNNTVRDLLGVDMHPADDFPQDDAGYGFDNIADVLSLSPALMEKYLTAAERVARDGALRSAADGADARRGCARRRRNGEARTFPARYDVHRPQPAERVSRRAPRAGRGRVRGHAWSSAGCGPPDRSRSP